MLSGVAISISLVPPLAVGGVCLGEGSVLLAMGALLLFVSNLVALVLAGTIIFAALGYSTDADQAEADRLAAGKPTRRVGVGRRSSLRIGAVLLAVIIPLAANTVFVLVLHPWTEQVKGIARDWAASAPGTQVTGVDFASGTFRIDVRTPGELPPTDTLLKALEGSVTGTFPVVVDTTFGEEIPIGTINAR